MALASDPRIPEHQSATGGFDVADGGSYAQPSSGNNELSRSKKGAAWCAITIIFGLSVGLGFSVAGPLVFGDSPDADSQDAGKAVSKFAFKPPIAASRRPRGDRPGLRSDTKMGLFGIDVPFVENMDSARFVKDADYVVNKAVGYVCQTPDVLEVNRYKGAKEGSFRVQFTLPGKDEQPLTLELMRTNQGDKNPRFGAVRVPTPFNPPLDNPFMTFRVVIGEVKDGTKEKYAGLRKGDIVRAMSDADGMHIMDGKNVGEFESRMKANRGEMALVIERPSTGSGPWDGFDPPGGGGFGERVKDLEEQLKGLAGGGESVAPNPR